MITKQDLSLMEENKRIIRRYNERLDEKGFVHESLGWTRDNVISRLNELIALIPNDGGRYKILDVGCGLGSLVDCLEQSNLNFEYLGIDINPRLIGKCKEVYPQYEFQLLNDDFDYNSLDFDYALVSGVFNHVRTDGDEKNFMKSMIGKYFALAKKGVVWNLLTDRVDYFTDHNVNYNVFDTLEFCYSLTNSVAMMNTHLKFEASFAVYKSNFDRETLRLRAL